MALTDDQAPVLLNSDRGLKLSYQIIRIRLDCTGHGHAGEANIMSSDQSYMTHNILSNDIKIPFFSLIHAYIYCVDSLGGHPLLVWFKNYF